MSGVLGSIGNSVESISKFAPDRFRAQFMLGLGYASANRFQVELPSIDGMRKPDKGKIKDELGEALKAFSGETRNMLCTAANLPGKEIQSSERKINNQTTQVAVGHTLPPVQLTFYLTNSYSMRKYFSNWMFCISGNYPSGAQYVGYHSEYAKQMTVRQYTKNGRRVLGMKLIDAYPISMSTIELNNQPQTAIQELTVQIAYRTYEEDYQQYG